MSQTDSFLMDPNPCYTDSRLSSQQVIESIASVLEEMCAINDAARQTYPDLATVTRFHSICKAPISLCDYLTRIRQFSTCSNSCFIVGLMFLDRAQRHANLAVDSLSAHRLIVTAVMIASKAFDDRIQKNKAYSIIGGLSNEEMNRLEIELLNALDFDLEILPADFLKYEEALLRRHSRYCLTHAIPPAFPAVSTPSVTPSVASPLSVSSGSYLSCSSPSEPHNVFFPVAERSVSSLSSSSAGSVSAVSSPDSSVLSSSLGSSAAASSASMHAFERQYSEMLVDPAN